MILHRGVEQLVARRAHNPKVTGSSPVPATKRPSESKDFEGLSSLNEIAKPECLPFACLK